MNNPINPGTGPVESGGAGRLSQRRLGPTPHTALTKVVAMQRGDSLIKLSSRANCSPPRPAPTPACHFRARDPSPELAHASVTSHAMPYHDLSCTPCPATPFRAFPAEHNQRRNPSFKLRQTPSSPRSLVQNPKQPPKHTPTHSSNTPSLSNLHFVARITATTELAGHLPYRRLISPKAASLLQTPRNFGCSTA